MNRAGFWIAASLLALAMGGCGGAAGAPIVVTGSPGQTLQITQALMRQSSSGTGAGVTLDVLDAGNEPSHLQPWQYVVVTSAPLAPQTVYQAQIAGTLDGSAFSRTFTFTTGG